MISIAKDFSETPAGRYLSDGPVSGEKFRNDILRPALSVDGEVVIILDGVEGYGSSFLEEAFGGAIREGILAPSDIGRLVFVSEEEPFLIDEIVGYMSDAAAKL